MACYQFERSTLHGLRPTLTLTHSLTRSLTLGTMIEPHLRWGACPQNAGVKNRLAAVGWVELILVPPRPCAPARDPAPSPARPPSRAVDYYDRTPPTVGSVPEKYRRKKTALRRFVG